MYPFYVITGKTALTFNPDKKLYKRGETVTINGAVKNLAVADAANLSLVLKTKDADNVAKTLATEAFTVSAGGSHPFSVTTTADAEGTIALTGIVAQSGSTLAEIADQYEVAPPIVTATLTAPDVVGNEQFAVSCELKNTGKTNAVLAVASPFTPQPETFTLSAGETRLIQYSTQISADASYSFTFSGDLNQTVAKTIKYGLAGTVAFISQAIYPEGKINVPVTVTNSGLLDGQMNVNYLLHQGAINTSQQASYYLAKGNNTADTLSFELTEGSYQVTATGQLPAMTAAASFSVRKLVKADLQLSVGAQTGTLLPATVSVTNLGYNTIDGTVRLSLVDGNGAAVWSSNQDLSLPQSLSPVPQSLAFSINLAAVKPGVYSIKAELLDTANQQLVRQTSQFSVLGAVFDLTQLPPYQTVSAGGSATMTFRVKNSGSQEGNFDLSFKADDLIDSTQTAWLKPGEEKEIAFSFQAATDLEEKDYSATYRLKSGGATVKEGVMAYHLAGLKLAVSATLDKQAYNKGDTATLTLTISQRDAGASPSLFARVNYAGYEEKRDFRLSGSQTLTFSVPLTAITGEKLFYGIYYQSGRSVYLNTLYMHKADGVLTVTTDKQVYNPGETVIVLLAGTACGNLTLTGPGDFTNTFAFAGSDTRSFVLPSSMTAGTYTVSYSLTDAAGSAISGSTSFDVAGIQVKVKEALLDKAKYASTDTMTLSLTIESNLDIPATVRTWVVDPAIRSSSHGLLSLINDILDLSKIESGKIELERKTFHLRSNIEDVIRTQLTLIHDKGLSVEIDISDEVPDNLIGDQLRLKQILLNLLGNAIKFTERGGIRISTAVIERHDDIALLKIDVIDTGIGIPPEIINKIFKPFTQADASTTRKYGGTGLGLSICSRLVELMNGRILIESREGFGSTFSLQVPFVVGQTAEERPESRSTYRGRPVWDGPPLRILLVDDNAINLMGTTRLLQKYGHTIVQAHNGAEAIQKWEQETFDAILMDIQMPVMNGIEAAKTIRLKEQGSDRHVPTIALTGRAFREEQDEILSHGFDGYISKPIELSRLFKELRRCLSPDLTTSV